MHRSGMWGASEADKNSAFFDPFVEPFSNINKKNIRT